MSGIQYLAYTAKKDSGEGQRQCCENPAPIKTDKLTSKVEGLAGLVLNDNRNGDT